MAKTRSQTRNTTVKKEQEDCKDILVLHSVRTAPRNKITKRRVNHLSSDPKVKIEECNDYKPLLQASLEGSRDVKYQQTSQKQKSQLVDVVVNHSMSKSEDIIALLVQQHKTRKEFKTQEQVSNLISYIVDGNMSVLQASVKANMSYFSAQNYYNKYKEDPNHHIPKPYTMNRGCTQDQIHKMINYIVDDNCL
jgi:hypothetical protein